MWSLTQPAEHQETLKEAYVESNHFLLALRLHLLHSTSHQADQRKLRYSKHRNASLCGWLAIILAMLHVKTADDTLLHSCCKEFMQIVRTPAAHQGTAKTTSAEAQGDSHAGPAKSRQILCCSGQGSTISSIHTDLSTGKPDNKIQEGCSGLTRHSLQHVNAPAAAWESLALAPHRDAAQATSLHRD